MENSNLCFIFIIDNFSFITKTNFWAKGFIGSKFYLDIYSNINLYSLEFNSKEKIILKKISIKSTRRILESNEAFSSCLLKFSSELESYTATLSMLSFTTALVVSFCGWLRA